MAKSARSKCKIAARNARRYTTGSDYQVISAARLNTVASRLVSRLDTPKVTEEEREDENDVKMDAPAAAPVTTQVEGAPQRISTARRNISSRARWRRKKGSKH